MRGLMRRPLIRLFVLNGTLGALVGALFVAAALALDAQGLRTLLMASDDAALALALLTASLSATFAAAAIGAAVMMLPERREDFEAFSRDDDLRT